MDQDKIERLLRSPIMDDQILGVNLAVIHKGRYWCRENFVDPHYQKRKKLGYSCDDGDTILDYGTFKVLMGGIFIEYWDKDSMADDPNRRTLTPKIIKYDEYTELSESL